MRGSGRERGRRILAWLSFGFAVVGGAALVGTFIGGAVVDVMGFLPGWVRIAAFTGVFIAMGVDLLVDGEPNQVALYAAMALPSMATAVPGRLSGTVATASHQLMVQVNHGLGQWLGTVAGLGLAVTCLVVSVLIGRRVIAKGGGR
jgi:hypothetical protein